jgi:shikimate 5-dehydrogenase
MSSTVKLTVSSSLCIALGSLALVAVRNNAARAKKVAILDREDTSNEDRVSVCVGAKTRFIISTSGRPKSLRRYKCLLQELLELDVAYIPISSPKKDGKIDPKRFTDTIKGMNCLGGAISKDIKHTVIKYLDEIDSLAEKVQSVNTVIRLPNDTLKGYNTDALGFRQAITNGIGHAGVTVKTAVVYGYGGVSSVVFHVLQDLGIRVFVTGRNLESAATRAAEFNVEKFDKNATGPCDLFVNATPVTDKPLDQAQNFLAALEGCKCAFDHEMPGSFLAEYCARHNIAHIPGTAMYYPQMAMQWQLFLSGLVPKALLFGLLMDADRRVS